MSVRVLLVVQDRAGREAVLRVGTMCRWKMGKAGARGGERFDVAGDTNRAVVARTETSTVLLSARPFRSARATRRWQSAVEKRTSDLRNSWA